MSNYRITRPVMEGSPMAFAGLEIGTSNEIKEKVAVGSAGTGGLSPPSANSNNIKQFGSKMK